MKSQTPSQFLKEKRDKLEVTDYSLAIKTGIAVSNVTRIMKGEQEPKTLTFFRLCKALDMSQGAILEFYRDYLRNN